MTKTFHGSKDRVTWTVVRNYAHMSHGENEERARADYARRAPTLHAGETIRLERMVTAEAWVQHTDIIESREKPA